MERIVCMWGGGGEGERRWRGVLTGGGEGVREGARSLLLASWANCVEIMLVNKRPGNYLKVLGPYLSAVLGLFE